MVKIREYESLTVFGKWFRPEWNQKGINACVSNNIAWCGKSQDSTISCDRFRLISFGTSYRNQKVWNHGNLGQKMFPWPFENLGNRSHRGSSHQGALERSYFSWRHWSNAEIAKQIAFGKIQTPSGLQYDGTRVKNSIYHYNRDEIRPGFFLYLRRNVIKSWSIDIFYNIQIKYFLKKYMVF